MVSRCVINFDEEDRVYLEWFLALIRGKYIQIDGCVNCWLLWKRFTLLLDWINKNDR